MLFAAVCWLGTFVTGPLYLAAQDAALQRLVGRSSAQVEAVLGEATASMTAGGTENLAVFRFYAGAQVIVWYGGPDGTAVKVQRVK